MANHGLSVQRLTKPNADIFNLVRAFRVELNTLNLIERPPSDNDIQSEVAGYFTENRTVFGAYRHHRLRGFVVLKEDDGVVWLDWLYVEANARREGIASALFDHAEAYAKSHGADKLFIHVHPDNQGMLKLLARHGYDALNTIEVTRKTKTKGKHVDVFGHRLRY